LRADLVPWPLNGRIAEQLGADGIGGEHQGWLAGLPPKQRRQGGAQPEIALIADQMEGLVADLLVRGVEDGIVQELKKRAGAHGRSAEAEHRAILAAALLTPPRRNLAELLAAMPDVGLDADFGRQDDSAAAADVFS